MKKIVLISLSLLMFTGMAGAERGKGMFEELNLTEDQQSQMQELKADHMERMNTARDQVKAETHDKMAEILTEEQMQQWQEMKAQKQERMKKRMKKMKHKKGHRNKHKRMMDDDSNQ
jgi:Spy/CpxP family protein refolding chaperone